MPPKTRILYASVVLPADDPARRVPRRRQSEEAARLVAGLCGEDFSPAVQSRSHSRSAIAAAASDNPGLPLGIDIEWMSPGRPVEAIARGYLSSETARVTASDFYRGWTFYEAYFKAFQRAPCEALLLETVKSAKDDFAVRLADGTQIIQHCVADIFRLCLVWRGGATERIALERRQPDAQ